MARKAYKEAVGINVAGKFAEGLLGGFKMRQELEQMAAERALKKIATDIALREDARKDLPEAFFDVETGQVVAAPTGYKNVTPIPRRSVFGSGGGFSPFAQDESGNVVFVNKAGDFKVSAPPVSGPLLPKIAPTLPASQSTDLADVRSSREQLRELMTTATTMGFGTGNPYIERARTSDLNPFRALDPKASAFKQMTAATKQIIGKGLEGGVLRKEDEFKYEAIIPRPGDTSEILKQKAVQLVNLLSQKETNTAQSLKQSGFRSVPQFPSLPGIRQPVPQPASEDVAALQWAAANPNDPRAKEIFRLHGSR